MMDSQIENNDIITNRKGRLGIGDVNGKDRREKFSIRAMKGKLEVINRYCKYCGHHKALKSDNILKCSKCKKHVEKK